MATNTTVATGEVNSGKVALSASSVDTVTFTDRTFRVRLWSADGASEIWYTTDGSTPTVGGKNCNYLPAAVSNDEVPLEGSAVKLISAGTPSYVVSRSVRSQSV